MSTFTARLALLFSLTVGSAHAKEPLLWGSGVLNANNPGNTVVAVLLAPLLSPSIGGTIVELNGANEIIPGVIQTPTMGTSIPVSFHQLGPQKWLQIQMSDRNNYWIPVWR